MKQFILSIAIVCLSFVRPAHAGVWTQQSDFEELLKSKSRPTMQQLIEIVGLTPVNNPFENLLAHSYDSGVLQFKKARSEIGNLPRVIAFMEYAEYRPGLQPDQGVDVKTL